MSDNSFDRISKSLAAKSSRRQALKLLGGGLAAGALVSSGRTAVTAQRPPVGALDVVATAGSATGLFTITNFVNQGGDLLAVGTVTIGEGTGALVDAVASALVTSASVTDCEILYLVLGPLDLNLLGLRIQLNQVVLDITAEPGPGNLLGNLLCAVAGLLDGGGPLGALAGLLNNILRALGQ